jgi:type II secretory pathway pseudopilin PulG
MLVVVAIIVVLAGIGGAILLPTLDKAKEDADRAQAHHIAEAAKQFMINGDHCPSAQELTQGDGQGGKALLQPDAILDRNKQPFQISEGQSGDIIVRSSTNGKDGQPIGNWKKGGQPPQ